MSDSRQQRIIDMLEKHLNLSLLEVIDETFMHNVPNDSESHFKVIAISDEFDGLSLLKRHQLLNRLLQEEFSSGLHALSLNTYTLSEWRRRQEKANTSPTCLGGKKKEQS